MCYSFKRSGGEIRKHGFVIQWRAIPLTCLFVFFVFILYIYIYICIDAFDSVTD